MSLGQIQLLQDRCYTRHQLMEVILLRVERLQECGSFCLKLKFMTNCSLFFWSTVAFNSFINQAPLDYFLALALIDIQPTCICPVDIDSLTAEEEYSLLKPDPAPAKLMELVNIIMADNNIKQPTNPDNALQLYHMLKCVLESYVCCLVVYL